MRPNEHDSAADARLSRPGTGRAASRPAAASTLISHNVMINDHRTSVRLEKEMWIAIKDIARLERCSVHTLCSEIATRKRPGTSLTAAIRVFIMCYFQAAATQEGHVRAGHGTGAHHATHVLLQQDNVPYYGLREFKRVPAAPV